MEARKDEILKTVRRLFAQYGIRNITMDEISRNLGISKKTLYKYYKNKGELVKRSVEAQIQEMQNRFSEVQEGTDCRNAIDCLMKLNKVVNEEIARFHPLIVYELKRYYPEAHKLLHTHRRDSTLQGILENIKRGKKEGLYRENLDPEFISNLYLHMTDFLTNLNPTNYPEYSLSRLHRELIRYHIRGIASIKGIEYLTQKFKDELS